MPASQSASSDVLQAALQYIGLGFSVVPVRVGQKGPALTEWKSLQTNPLTESAARQHFSHPMNIGIIGGPVSGNLFILDADDSELVRTLESSRSQLEYRTWGVRTGSGKLHVYLRSREPLRSTTINAGGRHLADIRADGEYVCAPPSLHPCGGTYATLWGSPQAVEAVDAPGFLAWVREQLGYNGNGASESTAGALPTESTPNRVLFAATDERRRELERKLNHSSLPLRVRRAVTEGASPGDLDWPNAPSTSEIDYGVVMSLVTSEAWTDSEIEELFATFPIGESCYQRQERSQHGWHYLKYCLDKARAAEALKLIEAEKAVGSNFTIAGVTRYNHPEEPIYEVQFKPTVKPDGVRRAGIVRLTPADLTSDHQIKVKVLRDLGWLPEFQEKHVGKHIFRLSTIIADLAEWKQPPEEATSLGHLRRLIVSVLVDRLKPSRPDELGDVYFGWREDALDGGVAYVHAASLLHHLSLTQRPAPTPEKVWQAVAGLGADETVIRFGSAREKFWCLPLNRLS